MGKYFAHWIKMGKLLGNKAPKIFNVNWFRTDKAGNFLWPGFGENLRVLEWVLNRCEEKVSALETPIGFVPFAKDINLQESGVSEETLKSLLEIDRELWDQETKDIENFYKKFVYILEIF